MLDLVLRVLRLFDRGIKRRFALAVGGSLLIALAEVLAVLAVLPLMQLITGSSTDSGVLGAIRDTFGEPSDTQLAIFISLVVLVLFVAKGFMTMAIRWWTLGFLTRQGAVTAAELLRYYLTAPMSLYVRRGTAELLRTLGDAVAQVYAQIIGGGMAAFTELITIVAMAVALFIVSPLPTVAIAAYFGVAGYLLQRGVKRRAVRSGERLIHAAYITTRIALQALGGIKEIKLRNEQEVFVSRYAGSRLDVGMAVRTTTFLNELPRYAMEILFILGIGLMTVTIYTSEPSDGALATLGVFAVAGYRVMPSTVRLLASINLVRAGASALELVEHDLIDARTVGPEPPQLPRAPLPLDRDVRLENLSFSYEGSADLVLRDVSITLPVGTSLALVGQSGAGKSTLVDLVLGLQRPTSGQILVDGADIAGRLKDWQQHLAVVPQDVFLLDGSIRENIRFSPDIDDPGDELLRQVIELAQLTELVSTLPDGVDTDVGERGARLSGGQRQRIGIARALFRQPYLLVLDEATSSLDNETERLITETIESLHGQITLIVVAHRLSTVRRCDQLVILEAGRVTGVGRFEELRAAHPGFARLVQLGSLVDAEVEGT